MGIKKKKKPLSNPNLRVPELNWEAERVTDGHGTDKHVTQAGEARGMLGTATTPTLRVISRLGEEEMIVQTISVAAA